MDADRLMTRLNPLLCWLLRSPLHFVLSPGLMLITVTGRRTGRRYTIPVGYQRQGSAIRVLVSNARRKSWWRNYETPAPTELRVRGKILRGEARTVPATEPEFRRIVETTFRRIPGLGGQFGISFDRRRGLSDDQWQTVSQEAALVRIDLTP